LKAEISPMLWDNLKTVTGRDQVCRNLLKTFTNPDFRLAVTVAFQSNYLCIYLCYSLHMAMWHGKECVYEIFLVNFWVTLLYPVFIH